MKARNEETVEDVQANGRGDASARMRQEERVITSCGRDAIYFYLQKHRYTALVTSFVYLPGPYPTLKPQALLTRSDTIGRSVKLEVKVKQEVSNKEGRTVRRSVRPSNRYL